MKEYSEMAAQTLPRGHSDMKGTRHEGPRYLASQPLGKWFGSVELVREVASGTFLNSRYIILEFRLVKI